MKLVVDTRTVNRGGVHRYAWGLLPHLVEKLRDEGVESVIVYDADCSSEPLPDFGARAKLARRSGFARGPDGELHRLLAVEGIDAYFSFDYVIDFTIQQPFVFTIHDATRFMHPELAYSDAEFLRRYGQNDLDWLRAGSNSARSGFVDALYGLTEGLLRRAAGVVTVSRTSLKNLRDTFPGAMKGCAIVRCGVDPERSNPGNVDLARQTSALPYLLYVGQVQPHKRVPWLLHSILREAPRLPAFGVALVGGFAEVCPEVKDVINDFDKEGRVQMLGRVPDAALTRLMREASACVTGSVSEGYGLPLIEALSVGCEVIAPKIEIFEEVLGPHAHLYDAQMADDLTRLCRAALSGTLTARSTGFVAPNWREEAAKLAKHLLESFA